MQRVISLPITIAILWTPPQSATELRLCVHRPLGKVNKSMLQKQPRTAGMGRFSGGE